MAQETAAQNPTEVNDFVEAYESAHAQHAELTLTDFLPRSDHPLYLAARRELIRVDLELRWQAGQRSVLADYLRPFPDLLKDAAAVQEIAFEEYRLRLLAGEDPAPADYEEQYGVTTTHWPRSAAASVNLGSAKEPPVDGPYGPGAPVAPVNLMPHQVLKQEQSLFLDLTPQSAHGDSWNSSRRGDVAKELLLENIHQSDSEAVFLLSQAMTALPEVGTKFLNFDLIAELGRGGFGRVYLARQGDLANRLVALKITIDLLNEEQRLAQLQHTNVVPIYSVHQAGPLHAVCMPYFGATTLADMVRSLHLEPTLPLSGKSLVNTVRARRRAFLDKVQSSTEPPAVSPPPPAPAAPTEIKTAPAGAAAPAAQAFPDASLPPTAVSPTVITPGMPKAIPVKSAGVPVEDDAPLTLTMLEEISYVEAVLWLAERLTDGLIHAHERGILHRDLKPANILLTDDGQPMLLDFNLSEDVKLRDGFSELQVGGTLPYMSPEQLEAFHGGKRPLDARSDVYALGVILYELLTGRLPFEVKPGRTADALAPMLAERMQTPPRLRRWNRFVTPAVEALVRHCLEPEPERRYQSVQHLREDLKRHRQHRPLRHAPEPSLRERAHKWVRRHPRLASPPTLGAVVALVLLLALAPVAWKTYHQWQSDRIKMQEAELEAVNARRDKQEAEQREEAAKLWKAAQHQYYQFRVSLASARALMETVNVVQTLPDAWPYEEKTLVDGMARCRQSLQQYQVLERPDWNEQPAVRHLTPAQQEKLCEDVTGLLFALGQAEQARFVQLRSTARHHAPVDLMLGSARAGLEIWGPWRMVVQAPLHAAEAVNERAQQSQKHVACRPLVLQAARLRALQGRAQESRDLLAAAAQIPLREGTEDHFWAASVLASEGRYLDALPLVKEATQKHPGHFGAWYLLALCRHSQGTLDEWKKAVFCFNACAALRPQCAWVNFHRGMMYLGMGDPYLADCDFDTVLKAHGTLASGYVKRATARDRIKKYEAAIRDLSEAIQLEPELPELYFQRAQVRAKLGDVDGARQDRRHFLETRPSHAEGWTYRGLAKSSEDPEDSQGALADFDRALEFDPNDTLALFSKARLLAHLRRDAEAVKNLDRVLLLDPNHTDARILRGLSHAKLKQRDLAVKDAELAVYGNVKSPVNDDDKKLPIHGDPTPARHYQAAEIYALTSRDTDMDRKRATELLAFALRHGYRVKEYPKDSKLIPLHGYPKFENLAEGLKLLGSGDAPRMRP